MEEFFEIGGAKILEKLQYSDSERVFNLTDEIIEQFFMGCDEEIETEEVDLFEGGSPN